MLGNCAQGIEDMLAVTVAIEGQSAPAEFQTVTNPRRNATPPEVTAENLDELLNRTAPEIDLGFAIRSLQNFAIELPTYVQIFIAAQVNKKLPARSCAFASQTHSRHARADQ